MSQMISYRSLAHSNLPTRQKSAIARLVERMGGPQAAMSAAKATAYATGNAVRQGGEAALVGGLLGVAHVELPTGLDYKVPGTSNVKVPIDAAVGVLGLAASVGMARDEYSKDLANVGSAAVSIFAFRKTFEFAAKKKAERGGGLPGGSIAGEFGSEEDEIVRMARAI